MGQKRCRLWLKPTNGDYKTRVQLSAAPPKEFIMNKNVRVEPLPDMEVAPKNKKSKARKPKKSNHKHETVACLVVYEQYHYYHAIICEYCQICGKISNFKFSSYDQLTELGYITSFSDNAKDVIALYPNLFVYYYNQPYCPIFRVKNIKELILIDEEKLKDIR